MSSEKTLIRCRDKLIENKLFEYEKGTKSKPNKYKISTVNFTANNKSTVNNTVDMTANMTVDVSNINRLDKDIYINLLNKYKKRMKKAKYFSDKIHIQNELKKDKDYLNLTEEEKNNMFKEIM